MGYYWEQRKHLNYYLAALRLARHYVPGGGAVLDVGSSGCDYISQLEGFPVKHAVDLTAVAPRPGVVDYQYDFLQFQPAQRYDLVLCLQVLEHLADPTPFVHKLRASGGTVIVSVPYLWPKGACQYHLQDPIDRDKLQSWTGPWVHSEVATDDGIHRLLAVLQPAT